FGSTFYRRGNDNIATRRTRHCTLHQQQVFLSVHTNDHERLRGNLAITHLTSHLLALENATRRLVLTYGTRRTMRQRVTMRRILSSKVPALDHTGKTLTF